MATLILSVTGSDRPGLTQALAGAVLQAGGNWLESHLSRLGGLYVGSVLVELDTGNIETLRDAVSAVDAQGLEVRIAPAADPSTSAATGEAVRLNLVGQDRPGIVHQVTGVMSGLEVNIESFETSITPEPQTGAPLFNLSAQLRLPQSLTVQALQAALEAISAEIMVDTTLTRAD